MWVEQAGDTTSAEALAVQADHGNTIALRRLAELREQAGDTTGAEALYRQPPTMATTTRCRTWPGCGSRRATPPQPFAP